MDATRTIRDCRGVSAIGIACPASIICGVISPTISVIGGDISDVLPSVAIERSENLTYRDHGSPLTIPFGLMGDQLSVRLSSYVTLICSFAAFLFRR